MTKTTNILHKTIRGIRHSISRIKKYFKKDKKLLTRIITLAAAALIFFSAVFLLWVTSWRIPTLDSFENRNVSQSTKIYDRTGEVLLYDVFQNIKRTVVPFEDISPNIKEALLAIEDVDFYTHGGIKITSIIRAVFANITGLGYNQGGSTITQQVVKNSLLSNEKTISRKIKEWVLAPKLEKILTKDEIFSMYLNEIPFGGSIYGVEEASNAFFGKKASEVTLGEAAYLASLPQAPTFYSPYGKNKTALDDRKHLVLREMLQNGFITQNEFDAAEAETITFKPQPEFGIRAPHFVMRVRQELVEKYGEQVLEEGGLRVITTLDYDLQKKAEDEALTQALLNKKNFNAENIGLVAIDPKNGDLLAMVGSRNYFDKEIDGNFNITTAHRQPGSAFKPFAYAQAFIRGYTPETVVFDVPTEFATNCPINASSNDSACYSPVNYDGKYHGPISLRNALAQSVNVAAIKTFYLAGRKETLQLAKDMGIQDLGDINKYGLTLVLGGGEVTLLDLTSAYGVFANEGVKNQPRDILSVKNIQGDTLEEAKEQPIKVLDPKVADQISSVLSDEQARAPAFGYNSPLFFPGRDVAVKTGTTNDYKDAIIVGYTPDIVISAWAGNNSNLPMEKKIAAFIIAPYWNKIMNFALKEIPNTKFTPPPAENPYDLKPVLRGVWQGGESILVDRVSGKRATEFTPSDSLTEIVTGGVHDILYWVSKEDPRGPIPTQKDDPQFPAWEYSVRIWAAANNIQETITPNIPTDTDDVHSPENLPKITLTEPRSGRTYSANAKIDVAFRSSGRYDVTKADYFVNDEYIGSSIRPFTFSFTPENVASVVTGSNTLKLVVYDEAFNRVEKTTRFSVR